MGLNDKERKIIKATVSHFFGDAAIYLFGSRLDESKKGGGIDLYVVPKNKEHYKLCYNT